MSIRTVVARSEEIGPAVCALLVGDKKTAANAYFCFRFQHGVSWESTHRGGRKSLQSQ
jgi:hypothetical protein